MTTIEVIDTIKAFEGEKREAAYMVLALLCHQTGSYCSGLSCGIENARRFHNQGEAEKLLACLDRMQGSYEGLYKTIHEIMSYVS